MTLEQLRMLVKVVQLGSFTKAATALGTQKSYASRVVNQLEAELGTQLLERTTRSLSVTEMGREVYERALSVLGVIEDTERLVQDRRGEPQGLLRLTCGVEFGMLAVGKWVEAYLSRHPATQADVEYTSRVVDLVHEGFDLAIRLGPLEESRLVARELGVLEYGLFACPHYLERHGTPRSLDELKQHSLLMFSAGSHRKGWQLYPEGDAQRAAEPERIEGPARLRVNNSFAARDATLRSLGVSVLPYLVAGEWVAAGRLRPVLPEWRPRPVAVNAVFPSNRYLSPKVRAMIDLALERFPDDTLTARRQALASCELPS